jgi:hypothetical protein
MRPIVLLLLCLAVPACAQDRAKASRTPAFAPHAYVMVRDARSGAVLPRLTDTRDPRFRAVNGQLDSISADLRCLDKVDQFGNATEHWSDTKAAYAADSILSVYIRFGGFCGGAHPINGVNLSMTFDLRTGKPVPFRELFADYDRDALAIVRALYPEYIARAEQLAATRREDDVLTGEEECIQVYDAEALARGYFAYTFSRAGLVVEPDFAHVVGACREVVVVPYDRLRPFAAPGGILARMVDAHAPRTGP